MKRILLLATSLALGLVLASQLPAAERGGRSSFGGSSIRMNGVSKFPANQGGNSLKSFPKQSITNKGVSQGTIQRLPGGKLPSAPINVGKLPPKFPTQPNNPIVSPIKPKLPPGKNPIIKPIDNPIVKPFPPKKPIDGPIVKPFPPKKPIDGPIVKPLPPKKPFDPPIIKPQPKPIDPPIVKPWPPKKPHKPCPPKCWPEHYPWCGTTFGVGSSCSYITSEPIIVQVPVTTEVWTVEEPALQEVEVGATLVLPAANLGTEAGAVTLVLGDISLGCLVNEWQEDRLIIVLPMLGLAQTKPAELAVILPDGSIAATVPVRLLPLAATAAAE